MQKVSLDNLQTIINREPILNEISVLPPSKKINFSNQTLIIHNDITLNFSPSDEFKFPTIRIQNCVAHISGLFFKGKIIVEESYLYLTNCTIQTLSSDDYLLSLQNKSRCECFHCIFNHSGNFAISIDNFSSLDFKKSLVRKSNYACISITGGSTFRGQQSEISDSKGDGLIFDTQSQGTLVDCLINNCTLRGISSNTGSTVVLDGCTFTNNGIHIMVRLFYRLGLAPIRYLLSQDLN